MPWSHCRLDPALQTIGGRVSSAERCHAERLMADCLSCQSMGIRQQRMTSQTQLDNTDSIVCTAYLSSLLDLASVRTPHKSPDIESGRHVDRPTPTHAAPAVGPSRALQALPAAWVARLARHLNGRTRTPGRPRLPASNPGRSRQATPPSPLARPCGRSSENEAPQQPLGISSCALHPPRLISPPSSFALGGPRTPASGVLCRASTRWERTRGDGHPVWTRGQRQQKNSPDTRRGDEPRRSGGPNFRRRSSALGATRLTTPASALSLWGTACRWCGRSGRAAERGRAAGTLAQTTVAVAHVIHRGCAGRQRCARARVGLATAGRSPQPPFSVGNPAPSKKDPLPPGHRRRVPLFAWRGPPSQR